MQIALDNATASVNQIRAYQSNYIQVNEQVYRESIIVAPRAAVKTWLPRTHDELKVEHFAFINELKPQVVLLGMGLKMHFPCPEIRLALQKMAIGFEFMDTAAACRTYNVLLAEDRNVVAALLLD